MGKTRSVLSDPGKRLLDGGSRNVTLEFEGLVQVAREV